MREATAIALRKGDNSFTLGKARFLQAWLAYRDIGILVPQVMEKYRDQLLPAFPDDFGIVPTRVKALLEESEVTEEEEEHALELARREIARQERDEYESLEEAIPDLIRLDRYDCRAWSRQKRAIQQFVLIRFNRAMERRAAGQRNALGGAVAD